ncbi:MATE family efflux transporter [uncultured Oscillibacter sp.]|uniref:MATE family efflux transporter n=1 Tax=uncultured Oscillibacter sp. TaxID=876091 RepID=UPI0026249EE0|nr:MATE family efflux transporter [uncultured Oscillibacter sp.]
MKASLDSYHLPVTGRNILRFVFPTIVMTVFNTFYTMVDGLFVSNLIGTAALSAINLTAPAIGLITAVSGMLATGGSAVVMKKMGEGREEEARQDFTLLILTNAVVGAVMMALGYGLMDVLLGSMGLSPEVFGYCHAYLSDYLLFTIPILLMYNFSLYLIAADRSRLSLICTVAGGVSNIVLDYVLIALAGLGIRGAAIATGLGYSLTAAAGLLVFRKRDSLLHFQKPVFRGGVLFHASANGLSELATSLVSGITTLLFNLAMLKYIGEDGVAAITIIMYVLMFVSALFIGYSYGAAPMISYYHGEGNHEKLKKLVRFSVRFILGASALCAAVSALATPALVGVFTRPDSPVYALAVTGNRLCSIALLFLGLNVFASSMFTALSNGVVSAVLAFSRSFLFTVACVQLLPLLLGVTGVWLATPAAELLGLLMSAALLARHQKRYGY